MEVDATNIAIEVYVYEQFTRRARFNKLCKSLNDKGLTINVYNYIEDREQFISNKDICILVACAGIEMLPATYVNNHLMKIEAYPTQAELYKWLSYDTQLHCY